MLVFKIKLECKLIKWKVLIRNELTQSQLELESIQIITGSVWTLNKTSWN